MVVMDGGRIENDVMGDMNLLSGSVGCVLMIHMGDGVWVAVHVFQLLMDFVCVSV